MIVLFRMELGASPGLLSFKASSMPLHALNDKKALLNDGKG
jgi:hypothetical protein